MTQEEMAMLETDPFAVPQQQQQQPRKKLKDERFSIKEILNALKTTKDVPYEITVVDR